MGAIARYDYRGRRQRDQKGVAKATRALSLFWEEGRVIKAYQETEMCEGMQDRESTVL